MLLNMRKLKSNVDNITNDCDLLEENILCLQETHKSHFPYQDQLK